MTRAHDHAEQPILTAAELREAEAASVAAGTSERQLMQRAGEGAAVAIAAFCGPAETLVLCGPGNNGGDGYVVAGLLAAAGWPVRVAALGEPGSETARSARASWPGPVESLEQAAPAQILVDALFGTGLSRSLEPAIAARIRELAAGARSRIALDLPSGVGTDDGTLLGADVAYDLTIAFGALKPANLLQPAGRLAGRRAVVDVGIAARSQLAVVGRPRLKAPGPGDHKYSRGMVAVVGGPMPGAAALAATAALRAGAGYALLLEEAGGSSAPTPLAVVRRTGRLDEALSDDRIGAVVIGPGLGDARARLRAALASGRALVLDADALNLLASSAVPIGRQLHAPAILTPHAGEFARLFGPIKGSRITAARMAAQCAGAVVILKGSDTVVAAPDGKAAIAPAAPAWLASAGTGDVLAGIAGAMLARGLEPFAAAKAAVWLHSEAARRAGPALIADDLPGHLAAALAAALAECL